MVVVVIAAFLRDRKLGKTYKLGYGYHQFTDALIKNLRDRFPSTNFIGIRVMAPRDARHFIGLYHHGWDREKLQVSGKRTRV